MSTSNDKSACPKLNDLLDRQIAYLESQPKGQSFETQFRLAMQVYQEVTEFARNLEARIDAAPSHEAAPESICGTHKECVSKCYFPDDCSHRARPSSTREPEGVKDEPYSFIGEIGRKPPTTWTQHEIQRLYFIAKGLEERLASLSATVTPAEGVIKALRELADGYFLDPTGTKQPLTIHGRTMRESIIAQALATLSGGSEPLRQALQDIADAPVNRWHSRQWMKDRAKEALGSADGRADG